MQPPRAAGNTLRRIRDNCAHGADGGKVQINGPAAQRAAPGQRNGRAAHARKQRAEK